MSDNLILDTIESYDPSSFLYDIDRGRKGLNEGFNNGLGRANEFLHGFQPATGYLFAAESGVGKTTMADYAHILCPHYDAIKRDKKIHNEYFSWEISKRNKKLRFASALMNAQYDVRLPTSYLLSKGKFRCSDEHWELAKRIAPQVDDIFSTIKMHEVPMNSRQVIRVLTELAKKYGRFITRQVQTEHGDIEEQIIGYTATNPELLVHAMFDHISLADIDPGSTLKQTIDNISKACVWFRNICGFSYTIIQQFGSDMQSTDRRKLDKNEIAPMRTDLGDSKYTYRDCNVAWGLVAPIMFGFNEFKGYDVGRLKNSYIHAFLMKNRDGFTGAYPLFMDSIAHTFQVLPRPDLDLNGIIDKIYLQADRLSMEKDKTDFTDQKPKLI